MTKSERGILSEWKVACDRRERYHERLIEHRLRTPFAEIDLLFAPSEKSSPSEAGHTKTLQASAEKLVDESLILIEVKSYTGELWGADLISRKQLARLARARSYIESETQKTVRLLVAAVSPQRILYFENL